jgi:hypothetical protein
MTLAIGFRRQCLGFLPLLGHSWISPVQYAQLVLIQFMISALWTTVRYRVASYRHGGLIREWTRQQAGAGTSGFFQSAKYEREVMVPCPNGEMPDDD